VAGALRQRNPNVVRQHHAVEGGQQAVDQSHLVVSLLGALAKGPLTTITTGLVVKSNEIITADLVV
jgi:hypothetical protein